MVNRSTWAIGLAIGVLATAPAAVAQRRPTNLRVSNFQYDGKAQRFTIEWDGATNALGRPYPSYQLVRDGACTYEPLNSGDKLVVKGPNVVVTPSGPRLGITVACSCPRNQSGYGVG